MCVCPKAASSTSNAAPLSTSSRESKLNYTPVGGALFIYTYMHIYIYIYAYVVSLYICVCIIIYTHILIYMYLFFYVLLIISMFSFYDIYSMFGSFVYFLRFSCFLCLLHSFILLFSFVSFTIQVTPPNPAFAHSPFNDPGQTNGPR